MSAAHPVLWQDPEDWKQCKALLYRRHENFPVAAWFLPRTIRRAMVALYAFARIADDLVDEPTENPIHTFHQFKTDFEYCFQEGPEHPRLRQGRWGFLWGPLYEICHHFKIPVALLEDLLRAFEQDLHCHHYNDIESLFHYSRYSANPIGRLLLHLFGIAHPTAQQQSDDLCTALQFIDFIQDRTADAVLRRRVYVQAHHIVPLLSATQRLLEQAQSLPSHLPWYLRLQTGWIYENARWLLMQLKAQSGDVPQVSLKRSGWSLIKAVRHL